jgi:hypothetical protein
LREKHGSEPARLDGVYGRSETAVGGKVIG